MEALQNPILWIAVGAFVVIIVATARGARKAATKARAPREVFVWEADDTLWGLHQPGSPVQQMARAAAAGFASIDPEEESRVVFSCDDGATWRVLPQAHWFR